MAAQQICLKWNSFQSNIVTSFEKLWEEEGLVDVTLASDGQCIQAHKVMLSACSPFFRKVFQSNPCQHPVIILQDVHFSELESLLCFVYKGEVSIDQESLPALLRAAETLQIRGLSGASEQLRGKAGSPQKLPSEVLSDDSLSHPPVKRQRSARPSLSPPPLALTPAPRPRLPSPSSSVEVCERRGGAGSEPPGPGDAHSDSPSPLECSLDDSQDDSTLNLALSHAKMADEDTGQCKGGLKSGVSNFLADPNFDSSSQVPQAYPPFPCPFCKRAYASWGFRRRHVKATHTQCPRLSCKWCPRVLPGHGEWERHVVAEHGLSPGDARGGLLILEEAHMVLQIPHPTRLDAFVDLVRRGAPGSTAAGPDA
ncbi:broad-complex core protein isoforms 1/2/3/4/5-like isoform X2 [Bacillus rossius redtenbacheri]|uniref:broad-complex core protein isoforms 1/2/3/4/5-like isoform X2 n=1 Tax=Bacillus rossius redtenbacheri TaxID=93214 RepID=UPI002FDD3A99